MMAAGWQLVAGVFMLWRFVAQWAMMRLKQQAAPGKDAAWLSGTGDSA